MMNLNNENILNIDELKKIYLKERLSVKKKFFSNYSGIENSKQNSNLIDKIIKKIFFILKKKITFPHPQPRSKNV